MANSPKDKGKLKKEDIEDSSSSEVEEDLNVVDCAGFVEVKRAKKDWKPYYTIIMRGSIFLYKDAAVCIFLEGFRADLLQDSKPVDEGTIHVKGYTVNLTPTIKKANVIELTSSDGKSDILFGAASVTEFTKWSKAISDAHGKEAATEPPARDSITKKKKEGLMARSKKKLAGDIATSGLGKKVIKSILNEETSALLQAIKKIIAKLDSKKKSDEIEKNVIKIVVKAYLLTENKKLDSEAFLQADKPMRSAFDLLGRVFNNRHRAKPEQIAEALGKVESFFKKTEQVFIELLSPHLSPKNMIRLNSIFGYMANAEFLQRAFDDPSLDEEIEKLVDAMEYYTQFHYN